MSQTLRAGDQLSCGHSAAGKGGGEGLVLQPSAEGEAHDATWTPAQPRGRVFTSGQPGTRHPVPVHRMQADVQRHMK